MRDERSKKTPIPTDLDAPSTDEVAGATRLREAMENPSTAPSASDDIDLVRSLRAAWSPDALDEPEHAALLEETLAAVDLRDALDGRPTAGAGAPKLDVVTALRAAYRPGALDEDEHDAIVERAVDVRQDAKIVPLRPRLRDAVVGSERGPRDSRGLRAVVIASTTVLALAASVVFWITTNGSGVEAPLAKARSTQPLFDEPFKAGETSARIDRIALARASDYRDNRFAKWGVR